MADIRKISISQLIQMRKHIFRILITILLNKAHSYILQITHEYFQVYSIDIYPAILSNATLFNVDVWSRAVIYKQPYIYEIEGTSILAYDRRRDLLCRLGRPLLRWLAGRGRGVWASRAWYRCLRSSIYLLYKYNRTNIDSNKTHAPQQPPPQPPPGHPAMPFVHAQVELVRCIFTWTSVVLPNHDMNYIF